MTRSFVGARRDKRSKIIDSVHCAETSDRIATFDNDDTLWVEQPMYVQLAFALDRVKARARIRSGRTSSLSRRFSKAT
jgi:hypothetical protein